MQFKKNKNLILLISTFMLLVAAYFVNDPFEQFSHSLQKSKLLLNSSYDMLEKINVFKKNKMLYSLEKKDGVWYIDGHSQKFLADTTLVKNSFEGFFNIKRFQSLGNNQATANKFFLNQNDTYKIELQTSNGIQEILLASAENRIAAIQLNNEKEIYATSNTLLLEVQKTSEYFRDKRLIYLEKENISSFIIFSMQAPKNSLKIFFQKDKWLIDNKEANKTFNSALISFLKNKGDSFVQAKEFSNLQPYLKIDFNTKSNTKIIYEIALKKSAKNMQSYAVRVNNGEWIFVSATRIENFLTSYNANFSTWIKNYKNTWSKKS